MEEIQENMCRLCLQISSNMEDIFDTKHNYIETIEDSIGIKVTNELEEFPTKICSECLSKIFLIRNFKEKCLKNDNWLDEQYSKKNQPSVKVEIKSEIEEVVISDKNKSVQNNVKKENSSEIKQSLNSFNDEDISIELGLDPKYINNTRSTSRRSSISSIEALPDWGEDNIKENTSKKRGSYKPRKKQGSKKGTKKRSLTKEKYKKPISKEPKEKVKKTYPQKLIPCHLCGKLHSTFKMKGHLNMHYDIRPFICEFPNCGKGFHSINQQRMHFKMVHTDFALYQCGTCGKRLKNKSKYDLHVSYHFDPTLPCDVCGKLLRHQKALQKHMLVHTGERAFKCETCSKAFQTRGAWKVHQRVHTKEKPYKCTRCEKSFAYNCLLKTHTKKFHVEIKENE